MKARNFWQLVPNKIFLTIIPFVLFSSGLMAQSSENPNHIKNYFLFSEKSPEHMVAISPLVGTYALLGVQGGVKASVNILDDGFLDVLNDSISVEVGVVRGQWLTLRESYIPVTMRWDFHLIPMVTVFAAPGFAIQKYDHEDSTNLDLSLSVGGFFNFANNLAMRAEYDIGDSALRGGVAFRL